MPKLLIAFCLMAGLALAGNTLVHPSGYIPHPAGVLSRSSAAPAEDYPMIPEYEDSVLFYEFEENQNYPILDYSYLRTNIGTNGPSTAASAWLPQTNGMSTYRLFDGGDIIRVNPIAVTTALTLSAWVKPLAYANSDTIIGQWDVAGGGAYFVNQAATADTYKAFILTNGNLFALGVTSSVRTSLNIYTLLTVTYDGSYMRFYYNDKLDATSALKSGCIINQTNSFITIGGLLNGTTPDYLINANIDSPLISSVALSGADISNLFWSTCWQNPSNGVGIGGASATNYNCGHGWTYPDYYYRNTLYTNKVLSVSYNPTFAAAGIVQDQSLYGNHMTNGAGANAASQFGYGTTNGYASFDNADTIVRSVSQTKQTFAFWGSTNAGTDWNHYMISGATTQYVDGVSAAFDNVFYTLTGNIITQGIGTAMCLDDFGVYDIWDNEMTNIWRLGRGL
jgi:hypothetical protein